MGKISIMFFCRGGSVNLEADNLENMDWIIAEMEKRGFTMWPGVLFGVDEGEKARENSHDDEWDRDRAPVDFCPIHGKSKKWRDTKDGGHYCGNKVDGSWCGYAENDAGVMRKPPKSMPDYVQF